jgi:NitT/TauT family transport system substrate-binding protein
MNQKFKNLYIIFFTVFLFSALSSFFWKKFIAPQKNPSQNRTKIVLGTDWFAQAEHGGFYQALAEGLYKKAGLDVEIKMGGPEVNGMQRLLGHEVDFFIQPSYVMLQAAKKNLPVVSVAAFFQKDLQILMAHPGVGHDSLASLKGKPIFISAPTVASIWGFLTGKYGYTDDQKRPYSHSLLPFLSDKNAIQEGLLTSEPFVIEKQAHFKPVALLLSDEGYTAYGELLTCTQEFERAHSDVVGAFVQASAKGWEDYLQNPSLGNALIKKDNPNVTDDVLAYAVAKLKEKNILKLPTENWKSIGKMTKERWDSFYSMLVAHKSIETGIDTQKIYTLRYVEPQGEN